MAQLNVARTNEAKDFGFEIPSALKSLFRQILYFCMGIVISRGVVFDKYSPFGTAMMASVPYRKMWALLCGEIFGYMLSDGGNVQYIAALIAIISMRWALNDLEKIKNSLFYAPVVTFIPTVSIAIVMNSVDGFSFSGLIAIAIESMISSVSAYFFSQTVLLASGKQKFKALTQQQLACCAMTGCILIMSLSVFCVGDISIGRILAIAAILFFSYYLGITGGSISGIGAGIVFSLSSQNSSYISGAYAFGGMISGILASMGRWAISIAFLTSHLIISLQTNDANIIVQGVYEVVGGATIFLLIPKQYAERFSKMLIKPPEQNGFAQDTQNNISSRLQLASDAISSVADCVSKVSEKLLKLSKKEDIINSYTTSIHEICDCCNLKSLCWNEYTHDTLDSFEKARIIAEKKKVIDENDFTESFKQRCRKIKKVIDRINIFCEEQIEKNKAHERILEIKKSVSEEFSSLSEILSKLSSEFNQSITTNDAIASEILTALNKENIETKNTSCIVGENNRIFISMEIYNEADSVIKKPHVKKVIEKICGKELDEFCLETIEDKTIVRIAEKPIFQTKINSFQHVCRDGTLCGDNLTYFNNGSGKIIVMLSDGMGTGGRAAVDSAMASSILIKLIKAGMGFDSAIKFANFAMISKSEDESLATLDVACIDLFTGEVEFMKAGAPFSLIRKKSKIKKLDIESLPIGILPEAKFVKENTRLENDDLILMFSDGAISSEDNWLENELSSLKESDVKAFSNRIVNEAKNRQKYGYDDDITAITIHILKNK
ncbi:MAG: SpoIIE family protein phosphatase [Oscillospiraceae bacterium]|nr:SpoIIE family protein phosphatase [Oscillospiraceae bacterium]